MIDDPSIEPFGAGPYATAQRWLHLGQPGDPAVRRRMIVAATVALGPLLVLAAADGVLLGPTPKESLLCDFGTLGRYLIALPVLLVAEYSYLPRLAQVVRYMPDSGIIGPDEQPRYAALVVSARNLVASRVVAFVLVVLAYGLTLGVGLVAYSPSESTWVAPITAAGHHISAAGWWRILISQPLFLIVVGTLFWRMIVWTVFLRKLSRFNLRLLASHPDRRGGLGFIPASVRAFPPLGVAIGTIAASTVAGLVKFEGHPVVEVEYAALAAVLAVTSLLTVPLLVFGPVLFKLRTDGIYKYGRLMHDVGQSFEARWLPPARPKADPVGAPDFSSMIDLSTVVTNVYAITPIMVDLPSLTPLVISTLVPFIPVLFIILPAQQIVGAVAKFLL
ncbi:MAG TPA: hypothetical protein VJN96_00935 [Vicinamibacterales bacterium]|nr:hypothetical protein [Vicinamibacterales bacterium]